MKNYSGYIKSHALANSREKGTPSVKLCIVAECDLDTGEAVQKTFYADLWLSEKAKVNTVKTLRAIGFCGDSFVELNGNCLEGAQVEISTDNEFYNGQDYEKVRFVNEPGHFANRGLKPCDDSTARGIAAKYDAVLRSTASQNAQQQKPAARPQAPTINRPDMAMRNSAADDDLPF